MSSWLWIGRSIEHYNISDQELKELLNKEQYPAYNSVSDSYKFSVRTTTDISTFEAFHNASINQLGLLLERFPKLLNDLGNYFAYYGKMDSVNFLIEKGCDINEVAIGIIKGLRELETRSLSSSYANKYAYFSPEKAEEMYQLKINFLKKLCEGSVDKDLIYSKAIEYSYYKVFFTEDDYDIKQVKKFYESGALKAAEKALEIINPNKSFRDELFNKVVATDYITKFQLKDLIQIYLGDKSIHHDEIDAQVILNKIIDRIFLSVNNLELVAPEFEAFTEELEIPVAENFAEVDSINLTAIGETQCSNSEDCLL